MASYSYLTPSQGTVASFTMTGGGGASGATQSSLASRSSGSSSATGAAAAPAAVVVQNQLLSLAPIVIDGTEYYVVLTLPTHVVAQGGVVGAEYNVALTDGRCVWEGVLTPAIKPPSLRHTSDDEFIRKLTEALGLATASQHASGVGGFEFALQPHSGGAMKLVLTNVANRSVRVRFCELLLESAVDHTASVRRMLAEVLQHMLDTQTRSMATAAAHTELLAKYEESQRRLDEAQQAKAENENLLLTSFVEVLNSKKQEIRRLTEEVTSLRKHVASMQAAGMVAQASASDSKGTDQLSDSDSDDDSAPKRAHDSEDDDEPVAAAAPLAPSQTASKGSTVSQPVAAAAHNVTQTTTQSSDGFSLNPSLDIKNYKPPVRRGKLAAGSSAAASAASGRAAGAAAVAAAAAPALGPSASYGLPRATQSSAGGSLGAPDTQSLLSDADWSVPNSMLLPQSIQSSDDPLDFLADSKSATAGYQPRRRTIAKPATSSAAASATHATSTLAGGGGFAAQKRKASGPDSQPKRTRGSQLSRSDTADTSAAMDEMDR